MKLTYGEIRLLRHTLMTTGEMEIQKDKDGKDIEVPSSRRLNGEESAQRRHFTKNTTDAISETENRVKEISDKHNKLVKEFKTEYKKENPKEEVEGLSDEDKKKEEEVYKMNEELTVSNNEKVKESFKEANELSKELLEKEYDIEVNGKVQDCVKKYFQEFGDTTGFAMGDDEVVEKIFAKLK